MEENNLPATTPESNLTPTQRGILRQNETDYALLEYLDSKLKEFVDYGYYWNGKYIVERNGELGYIEKKRFVALPKDVDLEGEGVKAYKSHTVSHILEMMGVSTDIKETQDHRNKDGEIQVYRVTMQYYRDGKIRGTVSAECDRKEPGRKWNPGNTLLQMAIKRAAGAVFKRVLPMGINCTYSDDDQVEESTDKAMGQGEITRFWNQLTKDEGYSKDQIMEAIKEIRKSDSLTGMTETQSKDIRTYLKDNYGPKEQGTQPPEEQEDDYSYDEEALK